MRFHATLFAAPQHEPRCQESTDPLGADSLVPTIGFDEDAPQHCVGDVLASRCRLTHLADEVADDVVDGGRFDRDHHRIVGVRNPC